VSKRFFLFFINDEFLFINKFHRLLAEENSVSTKHLFLLFMYK